MLFDPGPIYLGDLATARLVGTQKLPQSVVATYRLEPRDPAIFAARIGGLSGHVGVPYDPVPGLWATITVLPREEFGLLIGLSRRHGKARMDARRAFGRVSGALVDHTEIRALVAGYLRQAGV